MIGGEARCRRDSSTSCCCCQGGRQEKAVDDEHADKTAAASSSSTVECLTWRERNMHTPTDAHSIYDGTVTHRDGRSIGTADSFSMQQPGGASLPPNIKLPPHPLVVHAGRRACRSRSGHLAVLSGRSHPGHGTALAVANPTTSQDIANKKINQATKLRVDKFFELEMSVHDSELDQYGVVNNTIYAAYIEKAREELVASLGVSTGSIACTGNAMALSELNLKYFTPLRRGDRFVVKVRLAKIKGVRIFAEHFIERLPDRKLVLEATASIVCLDKDYRPTRVFPEMSSKLQHFFSSQDG